MAATDTTITRGTVSPDLVKTYQEIFDPKTGWLAQYNIERDEEIPLLGTALIAGLDPLLLGDPGVGKTWMIELMMRTLAGTDKMDLFNTMVFKESQSDDVLGPRDLPALKRSEIKRNTAGYLPEAKVGYLDEIFKASPSLTNSLLDIMAQRKLKVGANLVDCRQLLCIFFSSNELPEREDQQPMRDRIGLTKFVKPVRSPEGRKAVMRIQDNYQADANEVDMTDAPQLTLDQVAQIRSEVRRIVLPDPVVEAMDQAQERWGQSGFPPSQRRVGQMILGLKARAWARGDSEVATDDMILTADMAWNHPDHADKAREIVMEFANEFTRKANRLREALEPIMSELETVKKAIADAGGEQSAIDDQLQQGYDVIKDLRRLKRDTKQQIENGEAQGHNVSELEKVQADIDRSHSWIQRVLIGEEDDGSDAPTT